MSDPKILKSETAQLLHAELIKSIVEECKMLAGFDDPTHSLVERFGLLMEVSKFKLFQEREAWEAAISADIEHIKMRASVEYIAHEISKGKK